MKSSPIQNASIYRIASDKIDFDKLLLAMEKAQHTPCGATQEVSAGWVPPRGIEHGALIEYVQGHAFLKFKTESKKVPSATIKKALAQKVIEIEAQTGRKPGKKEKREISDEINLSLLPHAFTKESETLIWIDQQRSLIVINCANQSKSDQIITALIQAVDGLVLQILHTETSPSAAMAVWLSSSEPPAGFSIDRDCELKAADESHAVVKYGNHALDIQEIQQHIAQGKIPRRVGMTWSDRVSFTLTENLTLKKVSILDTVFEGNQQESAADAFDADMAIMTGELGQLIPDLIEALGGFADIPGMAKAEQHA